MTLAILALLMQLNPYCASSGFNLSAGSPAIDYGVVIQGFHCSQSGSALNCVQWYGAAPDAGACEFTSSITPPPSSLTCTSVGQGVFYGCYYDNIDFTNLKVTRTDSAINFEWMDGSPDPLIAPDTFSVTWQGDFDFPGGQNWRFTATTDDGMRVYVDGLLLIDQWRDQAPTTYTADILLSATRHRVKVEYYDSGFGATAKLSWAPSGQPPPVVLNTAPIVDAGAGIIVTMPAPAILDGSVRDDGLPSGQPLVWNWRKVSGPGNATVNIQDANALQTRVTFSKAGTYTFRLTASDGELTSSSDMNVQVRRK
jgi:PA14 domain